MTIPQTLLRDTAISLVPLVGVGAWIGGFWGLLGTLCTGLAVLANLWVLSRLVTMVTSAMEGDGEGAGLAGLFMLFKLPIVLGVATLLVWLFGPIPVVLGMCALMIAVFVRGVIFMFQGSRDASDDVIEGELPQRS
jgi:hypothetical protein